MRINTNHFFINNKPYANIRPVCLLNSLKCDTISFSGVAKNNEKQGQDMGLYETYTRNINSSNASEEKAAIKKLLFTLEESDIFDDEDLLKIAEVLIKKALSLNERKMNCLDCLRATHIISADYNLADKIDVEALKTIDVNSLDDKEKKYLDWVIEN